MAARPVVKDISINLLNAPKELMLGNKSYALNFMIMNTKSEQKDLVLNFSSESMKMDQATIELKLGPQEKKNFTVSVTPTADGALDLSVSVVQRKTITYKETVLEGQENVVKEPEPVKAPEKLATPAGAPSTPVKPVKPTGTAAAPVKPIKPVKPSGEVPPAVKPVKPVKPSGEAPPAVKPVKPVKPSGEAPPAAKPSKPAGPSPMELLEKRIGEIRDAYMAARGKLQSLQQGTPEYKDVYQNALKLKEDHDKLKAIFEAGGPVPDDIIKAATPAATPVVQARQVDPVEELKLLMVKYNELRAQLGQMDQSSGEYGRVRTEAMNIQKEYTEKLAKAKAQGLVQ